MPDRNATVIIDQAWIDVPTPVVPGNAAGVDGTPDCVFPECGALHSDAHSSVCRMCGRRTTKSCLKAYMEGTGDQTVEKMTDQWMEPHWVCPLCALYLHKGEATWTLKEEDEGDADANMSDATPKVRDLWELMRGVDNPNTKAILEEVVAEMQRKEQQAKLEREGLTGTRITVVEQWRHRMQSPALHAMAMRALRERFGKGADDAVTAATGPQHELRVALSVLDILIPIVSTSPEAVQAAHNLLVRLEGLRLREWYGFAAQMHWERRLEGMPASALTEQLFRSLQSQAQSEGEKEKTNKRRRTEGAWDEEEERPVVPKGGKGGKGSNKSFNKGLNKGSKWGK
eukprot:TRINITY_DN2785_c0_g1_i15.p1 TRINITY_DN2785_c0_g1~~TRINITY_DN2785_c0_g1_i15.p1  ORF type:complete len:342 (+),score=81.05 TRINITY_DN2785_c0_g1_i15:145-1170(+)